MKIEKITHSLELEENIELHKKGWIVQRILWVLLFLFITAAGLGFFGDGPLSKQKMVRGTTTIAFEKYMRYSSDSQIKIITTAKDGITQISFPQPYLNYFELENATPQPEVSTSKQGRLFLTFNTIEAVTIDITLKPKEVGRVNGQLMVNKQSFDLSHLIYP